MNYSNHIFLTLKDHSVTNEQFDLLYDSDLDMLVTSPKPTNEVLSKYYESDDYISHTDAKRTLFEKMYHFVKNIALRNKLKLVNSNAKVKGKILDLGAGTGDFLLTAKNNGWDTVGVEPNQKARSSANEKGILLFNDTSQLASESFDVITMWHVLEHVPDLDFQILELKRLLKSDGTIIIAVPNFNSFDAKHYGSFWAAYDVPRHLWHFSKTAIKKLFLKHEINLIKIFPMKFDSFYVSLLSEKYANGKMNFIKGFYVGLVSNLRALGNNEYSSLIYVLKKQ